MRCHMQATILKPEPKAKSEEPKAKSQKPNARSQSQKPKAKSKSEILAPNATKNVQIRDFGSKIQQVARKTAPDWTTKNKKYALPLQLWCYSSGTKSDAVKACCKSSGTKSDALKCGEKVAVPNRMLGNCVAEEAVPNRMLSSQKYSGLMQK